MSNRHSTIAWGIAMPSTPKFVLIYVAGRANDDGDAYFTIETACANTGLGERVVQKSLAQLETWNFLERVMRRGRSTVYRLTDPLTWEPPQLVHPRTTCTPAPDAPPHEVHPCDVEPPHHVHPRTECTPAPDAGAPAPGAPAPAPGAPISSSLALLSLDCSSASAPEQPAEEQAPPPAPTRKAHVLAAMAMIEAGIPGIQVNPQHPDLIDLAAVLPLREFTAAAAAAVKKRVPNMFAYALGILRGRATELADRAGAARAPPDGTSPAAVPPPNATFEGKDYAGSSTPAEQFSPAMRAIIDQRLKRDGDAVVPEARTV
ncbi:helix-turn-helix domain-containing protein [Dyella marensis]|uniref:Helix-turn-helix domain-containing protein n=1 Tax=Dyella marensis TaxID=500610 RepID=A0A1I2A364_9GAMM|nr:MULTISPECIES: helix-turn-helix domain-containing protein [Dyella]SFE37353.1 hypothetical protein SAMN02799615_00878 [Dyella marensis]